MLNEGFSYLRSILPEQKIFTFALSVIVSALIITTPTGEQSSIIRSISEIKINEIILDKNGAIGSLKLGEIFFATFITVLSKIASNSLILTTYRSITSLLANDLETRFSAWEERLKDSEISAKTAKETRNKNIEKLHAMKELLIIPNTIIMSFIFLIYMSSWVDWIFLAILSLTSILYSANLSIYFLKHVFTYETIIRFRNQKSANIPEHLGK